MKIRHSISLQTALQQAEQAVRLIRDAGQADLAKDLESVMDAMRQERFVIGVIGATKRGKSTLINGLLRRRNDDCAPIAMAPATNTISIFGHSPESSVKVWFQGQPDQAETISEREIRLYATEKHNPGNKKQVRSIEVLAPFEGLEKGVFLVDTPGAGNALEQMHTEVLLNFLPNADAVVFLVTGEKPLTESEKNLLAAVRKKDVGKLFFAVNMTDRMDSGDITPDEFAEGIQHNRQILDSIGLRPKLYSISAKNYFESQSDPGTEELLRDLREMIGKERLNLQAQRLSERTQACLHACEEALNCKWQEAQTSKEQLGHEIEGLKKARDEMGRGRPAREAAFRQSWKQAFDKLEEDLSEIRRQLKDEYRQLIEDTSASKLTILSTTIHADVVTRFGELLEPRIRECEDAIRAAQKAFTDEVQVTALSAAPQLERIATPLSQLQGVMNIALAGLPAMATGTLAAMAPGAVGSLILSTAPAVTFELFGLSTWWPAAIKFVAGGTAGAVSTALTAVTVPVSILAFGVGVYRAWQSWSEEKYKNKNTLLESVRVQIDEVCGQVQKQLHAYRDKDQDIMIEFQYRLEAELGEMEKRLNGLLENRPSERELLQLEEKATGFSFTVSKLLQRTELLAPVEPSGTALVDTLV